MAYNLEFALVEFDRWGTGSRIVAGITAEFTVHRLADHGWERISTHGNPVEADEAMIRARLDASIKAALGQFAEIAA